MSTVRMCDRCGRIFSENADDWSTFSGTRRVRNKETGGYTNVEMQQDACPRCTSALYNPPTPEIQNGVDERLNRMADSITDDVSGK